MRYYKQYGFRLVGTSADYALIALRCVFAAFLMVYFYKGAAPVLSFEQNILSKGTTSYSPIVGSAVLTCLLVWLQSLVSKYLRFPANLRLLSFLPSSVLAVLLTAFYPNVDVVAIIACSIIMIGWVLLVVSNWTKVRRSRPRINLIFCIGQVLAMFLFIGFFGNTDSTLNYEARSARFVLKGNYAGALKVGDNSLETSPRLTAIRAFALSHIPDGMGNMLFDYPIPDGGSENLNIPVDDSLLVLANTDSLRMLVRQSADSRLALKSRPVADYRLCAFLLDRDLAAFAKELPHYYNMANLPKYYAQAITLYARQNPNMSGKYNNQNVLADYLDFKEEEDKYSNEAEKKGALMKDYGDTYWWYYFFGNKGRKVTIKKSPSFCQLP